MTEPKNKKYERVETNPIENPENSEHKITRVTTLKIVGPDARFVDAIIKTLSDRYITVVTSRLLLNNESGDFHIFLSICEKPQAHVQPIDRDSDLNIDQIRCWSCQTVNSKWSDVCRKCGESLTR